MFYGYNKQGSITQTLLTTGHPSFTTILHNHKQVLKQCIQSTCPNSLILMFSSL